MHRVIINYFAVTFTYPYSKYNDVGVAVRTSKNKDVAFCIWGYFSSNKIIHTQWHAGMLTKN